MTGMSANDDLYEPFGASPIVYVTPPKRIDVHRLKMILLPIDTLGDAASLEKDIHIYRQSGSLTASIWYACGRKTGSPSDLDQEIRRLLDLCLNHPVEPMPAAGPIRGRLQVVCEGIDNIPLQETLRKNGINRITGQPGQNCIYGGSFFDRFGNSVLMVRGPGDPISAELIAMSL